MKFAGYFRLLSAVRARTALEFAITLFLQLAASVGSFVAVKLLTARVSPSVYGQVGLTLTALTLAQMCVAAPAHQTALRFYAASRETGRIRDYYKTIAKILSITAGASLLIGLAGSLYVGLTGGKESPVILAASLTSALYSVGLTLDAIQSGARNRRLVAIHQLATQWLRPLFACLLIGAVGRSTLSVVCGFLTATILVLASQLRSAKALFDQRSEIQGVASAPTSQLSTSMVKYALPFVSWGFVSWLQTASDRWFLEIFRDARSVGLFTVAYQLGYTPILFICTALSTYVAPTLFHLAGGGDDPNLLKQAFRLNWFHVEAIVLLTLVMAGIEYACADRIIIHLSTHEYLPLAGAIPWMTLACGLFSTGQALSFFFLLEGDSASLIPAKVGTAVLGSAISGIFVFRFGSNGAVAGSVLFGALYCFWMLFATLRKARQNAASPRIAIAQSAPVLSPEPYVSVSVPDKEGKVCQ